MHYHLIVVAAQPEHIDVDNLEAYLKLCRFGMNDKGFTTEVETSYSLTTATLDDHSQIQIVFATISSPVALPNLKQDAVHFVFVDENELTEEGFHNHLSLMASITRLDRTTNPMPTANGVFAIGSEVVYRASVYALVVNGWDHNLEIRDVLEQRGVILHTFH